MEDKEEIKQSHHQGKTEEEKPGQEVVSMHSHNELSKDTKEDKDDNYGETSAENGALEEKEEMKQSYHQEETKEEQPDQEVVFVPARNQLLEDSKEDKKLDNEGEISAEIRASEAGEVGEKQALKKPKAVSNQKHKNKLTVPQPFSLATDRRMSRERRGGSEQPKETKPKLSKSISLNSKAYTQISLRTERRSETRHGNSTNAITIPRSTVSNGRVDKRAENAPKAKEKVQGKEIESKKSQGSAKEGKETEIKKLQNSSTFKASPLPSFYHRKDLPPKPEIKKIPVTRAKSPVFGRRSKSMSESRKNCEIEENNKRVSRTISSNAKETINKLLRGTWKSPQTQEKKMVKTVVPTHT